MNTHPQDTPSAILFNQILHRCSTSSPLLHSVPLSKHPETAERRDGGEDGRMGRGEGGAGHPGIRERHPFAHQLFFLLSEPGRRERPPLSLWDHRPSSSSSPSSFSTPYSLLFPPPSPPSSSSHAPLKAAWMESHIQWGWMGWGGNG